MVGEEAGGRWRLRLSWIEGVACTGVARVTVQRVGGAWTVGIRIRDRMDGQRRLTFLMVISITRMAEIHNTYGSSDLRIVDA